MATYNALLLSGLPGSGKSTLAKKLSGIYGWPVHSIGGLWRGQWKSIYKTDEEQQENPFPQWWAGQPLEAQQEMNRKAREVIAQGNVIGDFRYSVCCEGLPALFVFVTADLEVRVQRALLLQVNKDKTTKQIRGELLNRETEEIRIGKQQFGDGYDYRNLEQYNVVVNSGLLSLEQETAIVKSKMLARV